MKKIIWLFLLFSLSVRVFGGEYCVFPFENRGDKSLNYLKYGFEIYFESIFNSRMYERVETMEDMDLPPSGNYSFATQIMVAKHMGATYLINGTFEGDENNLKLTVRIFDVNSSVNEYSFGGSVDTLLNKTLKDFTSKFEGTVFPFNSIKVDEFKKFSLAISLLCIYKDASLCRSFKAAFEKETFYAETIFDFLYEYENYKLAGEFFDFIESPDSKDFLKMGMIKVKEEDFDSAIDFFKKGNELNPDDVFINNIAGCFLMKKNYKVALKVFTVSGNRGVFMLNKSLVLCANGKYKEALDLLKGFCETHGLTEEAGSIFVFILEKKGVDIPFFKDRFSTEDIYSNFVFLDDENFDFDKQDETIRDYREKSFVYLKEDRERAKEYLLKLVSLYPFDEKALRVLCMDFKLEDFCKLLDFLGE